jgi:hypothetical protein
VIYGRLNFEQIISNLSVLLTNASLLLSARQIVYHIADKALEGLVLDKLLVDVSVVL